MTRSLTLRREALAPLDAGELAGVAGGQYSGEGRVSCAVTECVDLLTTQQITTIVSRQITCYACNTFVTGC